MPCRHPWPVPECGFNGECYTINGTDFCRCDPGWSQSLEFSFFIEEKDLSSSICIYNQNLINGLYILIGVLAVLGVLLQSLRIESFRQVKRQMPHIGYSMISMGIVIYRIHNPDKALCGIDPLFTFFISVCSILTAWQGYIFLNKYLKYIAKKAQINSFFDRAKIYQKIYFGILVVHTPVICLLWVATYLERSATMIVFQTVFAYNVFRLCFQVFFFQYALSEAIKDFKEVIHFKADDTTKVTNGVIIRWMEKNIPRMVKRKRVLVFSNVVELCLWGVALVNEFFFQCWSYLLPILGCLLFVYALAVIIASKRKGFIMKQFAKYARKTSAEETGNVADGFATEQVPSVTTGNSSSRKMSI
mmetsp:Transcript_5119/g.5923  ORF Transcript_5119/g.5923 Transcript_5119/m.5923 type:complete len:360 (-) Transcript_5119:386-1465(-)